MLQFTHNTDNNNRQSDIPLNHPVEFMRLTLTYEGTLHAASAGDSRTAEKQAIRREFHKQLKDVWNTHLALNDSLSRVMESVQRSLKDIEEGRSNSRSAHSFPIKEVGNFLCIPLVCRELYAICELDILFLRREPAGGLVNQAGDIDNRIKVLFDALRAPLNVNEIPTGDLPADNETPFFCLLEDDQLITSFRLESDQLLGPPRDPKADSDARVKLVVRATVKVQRLIMENIGLGDMV